MKDKNTRLMAHIL